MLRNVRAQSLRTDVVAYCGLPPLRRFDHSKCSDSALFVPLAGAFCADSSVTDSSLRPLIEQAGLSSERKRPGQICGHVFKSGELTYSCKWVCVDLRRFASSFQLSSAFAPWLVMGSIRQKEFSEIARPMLHASCVTNVSICPSTKRTNTRFVRVVDPSVGCDLCL